MPNAKELKIDASTIKTWVELYTDSMYSWAYYKTSNKETAEDLVQETFMVAVQALSKFEGESQPKSWLFSILNNKINDHYRKNFRQTISSEPEIIDKVFDANGQWNKEEGHLVWVGETEHLLDNSDFQNTLGTCMKKLPSNWFAAIQLKYLEEKNSAMICHELQITPTNFWQILHRAKLHLRKCLEINWFKK